MDPLPLGVSMKIPLIVDEADPKWALLGQILNLFASRPVKQQLARQGLTPVLQAALMCRILLLAIFFKQKLAYVLTELAHRSALRQFAHVTTPPTAKQLASFLGRFTAAQFLQVVLGVLNTVCVPRPRGRNTLLVDATEIAVDLNWFRKKYSKRALAARDYRWGFAPSKGYYIGYKLTLVLAHPSLKPLCVFLHPGSPSDVNLYDEIMRELRRRRLARNGDLVVWDKGYCSYLNYMKGVTQYKTIPGIFPKKNMAPEKILGQLAYPLPMFGEPRINQSRKLYNRLKAGLKTFLGQWKRYKKIRSRIEDFFKVGKGAFGWGRVHRYTERSALKYLVMGVLLVGLVIHLQGGEKGTLQRLSEW
jgi:hypothetical protein